MSTLTRYGSVFGTLPAFTGRIFYVAPGAAGGGTAGTATYQVNGQSYSASDNNDGLSPERALASIGKAITLSKTPTAMSSPSAGTSASSGTFDDVILLLPGSHNLDANSTTSAVVPASAGRLLITGVPGSMDFGVGLGGAPQWGLRTKVTSSISDNLFNLKSSDIEIAWLHMTVVTAKTGILVGAASLKDFHIHDCVIDTYGVAASTSTVGIDLGTNTASRAVIQRCSFLTDAAQGAMVSMVGSVDVTVAYNSFMHKAGTIAKLIATGAANDRTLILENTFTATNTGVVTVGVDGTGATLVSGVHAAWNIFNSVGTVMPNPFKNFGTNTFINLTNNYQGSVGAGAGGALITTAI